VSHSSRLDARAPELEREIAPWDMQSIIFTSGTTGPSKGVMSSYVHLYSMAKAAPFLDGTTAI
jgi:crotonobetaine/carnitine-CoA ligase